MPSRKLISVASGVFVATLPTLVSAQQFTIKPYADAGGWTIERNLADGQHMSCAAVVPNTAAAKQSFENSAEGWTLVVATTAKGIPGDEVKGAIEIDGKSARGVYYRRDDGRAMIFLKNPQVKALGSAKTLTAVVGKEKVAVALTGIDAALRKTVECTKKAQ